MDHYPESLETKCYPCFSYSEDRDSRTIFIGVPHDMARGSGPDSLNASYHGKLNHTTQARPATHATVITAYLIFLRVDILDQVLAMLFPV